MMGEIQFGKRPGDKNEMGLRNDAGKGVEEDAKLEQVLADFRASVRAWSEAEYSRPRSAEATVRRRSWRLAAGWALGLVLVAGGVTGGVLEHQRQEETARSAAAQEQVQQQKVASVKEQAEPQVQSHDPNLMATVDSDTAQEVPDAMEPLAQLMEEGQ